MRSNAKNIEELGNPDNMKEGNITLGLFLWSFFFGLGLFSFFFETAIPNWNQNHGKALEWWKQTPWKLAVEEGVKEDHVGKYTIKQTNKQIDKVLGHLSLPKMRLKQWKKSGDENLDSWSEITLDT